MGNKEQHGAGRVHKYCNYSDISENNNFGQYDCLYDNTLIAPRCTYIPSHIKECVGFVQDRDNTAELPPLCHLNGQGAIDSVDEYFKAAEHIRRSGVYNCDGARIPVASHMNLNKWAEYVDCYKDRRLLQFLVYGFPLGRISEGPNREMVDNHASAIEYREDINQYLRKEIRLDAILGSLDQWPVPGCHVSPLMTTPKDIDKRRIIVDLSYSGQDSVNGLIAKAYYDGRPFALTLPSLDYLIQDIINCPRNPRIMKIEIERAFRNVHLDPADVMKLGICHEGKYYIDKSLAFGAVHGTAIFQRITDAIRNILRSEGIIIWNYIDDLFACAEESEADYVFCRMYELIEQLGLPINPDKVVSPTTIMTCMGIRIDAENKTLSLTKEKLHELQLLCDNFVNKCRVPRRTLQSLLGKLLYMAKILAPARAFLNRMLWYLRTQKGPFINLGEQFRRDLYWFRKLLANYHQPPTFKIINDNDKLHVFVDASLQGLGAVWGNKGYAEWIPNHVQQGRSIVHFEMYNVYVAISHWGNSWRNHNVFIHLDNMAVVHVLNTMCTNDEFLGVCIRNVLFLAAKYNLHLSAGHIPGALNSRADALSCLKSEGQSFEWVCQEVHIQQVSKEAFNMDFSL